MDLDHSELLRRIAELRAAAERGAHGPALVEAIETTLSDGYASALAGEARLARLEEDLARAAGEHRSLERSVARLREALAAMHDDFVTLGGARLR